MRKNPLNKGIIMENAAGIGTVTSEMVEARARELAAINGRPSSEPSETDYQQAKRELTGEAEMDPQEESSESIPESEGWDPVPGSTGRQAADSLGGDEDAERRSGSPKILAQSVAWQLPDGPDAQAVAELERSVLAEAALCCAMDSSTGPA